MRHSASHKLLPDVLERIQKKLQSGASANGIAKNENISEGSIRYAIKKKGQLKKLVVKDTDAITTRSDDSYIDAKAADGIGIAAIREEDTVLALIGAQDFAPITYEHNESVLSAGVLFSFQP